MKVSRKILRIRIYKNKEGYEIILMIAVEMKRGEFASFHPK